MAAIGQPDMGDAAAEHADHHRLDHGQGEQRGDGGVDRIAAGQQHLRAGRRGQRMVGHHHAARAGGGLLLAGEGRRAGCRGDVCSWDPARRWLRRFSRKRRALALCPRARHSASHGAGREWAIARSAPESRSGATQTIGYRPLSPARSDWLPLRRTRRADTPSGRGRGGRAAASARSRSAASPCGVSRLSQSGPKCAQMRPPQALQEGLRLAERRSRRIHAWRAPPSPPRSGARADASRRARGLRRVVTSTRWPLASQPSRRAVR